MEFTEEELKRLQADPETYIPNPIEFDKAMREQRLLKVNYMSYGIIKATMEEKYPTCFHLSEWGDLPTSTSGTDADRKEGEQ